MKHVNRTALLVRPKQPMLDWLRAQDPNHEVTLDSVAKDSNVYLVNEIDMPDAELPAVLDAYHEVIFENELNGWYTDEGMWPKDRTLALFHEWFKVELHTMLIDLTPEPLHKGAVL